MLEIHINALLTTAISILVLLVGSFAQKHISILSNFFIPSSIIGGLIFSVFLTMLNYFEIMQINLNTSSQHYFMLIFFSTIGFAASLKFLFIGGRTVIILLICMCSLVILQNILGICLANFLGFSPAFGLANGSITMIGGHGTGLAFSEILENNFQLDNSATITAAAATFGLIAGSLSGGPIAHIIMKKYNLKPEKDDIHPNIERCNENRLIKICQHGVSKSFAMIILAIGFGSLFSTWCKSINIILPDYIGTIIAAAILRNLSDISNWFSIRHDEIQLLGSISLSIFLAMALMQIKLLALMFLALPMCIILSAQLMLVLFFARFVIFKALGKNYDSVVITCGTVGLSMGATPNAIANMEAFTSKNYPAPQAFFVVPIVGSILIDFFNAGIITTFLNFLPYFK